LRPPVRRRCRCRVRARHPKPGIPCARGCRRSKRLVLRALVVALSALGQERHMRVTTRTKWNRAAGRHFWSLLLETRLLDCAEIRFSRRLSVLAVAVKGLTNDQRRTTNDKKSASSSRQVRSDFKRNRGAVRAAQRGTPCVPAESLCYNVLRRL
jgi:hypothetical protein